MDPAERMPLRIDPCPIAESVFEIRFQSSLPADAVFGVAYSSVKHLFQESTTQKLPVADFPEPVKAQNPALRYQAHHRLTAGNMVLGVGPGVLAFSNVRPYIGWSDWVGFLKEGTDSLGAAGVLGHVERIGLRYINVFEGSILDKLQVQLTVMGNTIADRSTNLRTEIHDSGLVKILQIGNAVQIAQSGHDQTRGSVVDIDCVRVVNESADTFLENCEDWLEEAHRKEKELFFGMLKDDFLASLNPEYGSD